MTTPGPDTLVSVVLATCQGEAFIGPQIESILCQTHSRLELIICDDASTDRTTDIVESYRQKDSRVQLHIHPVRLGLNRNFEQGLRRARGPFIALSDQDDLWRPDKIDVMLRGFSDSAVVLMHGQSLRFTETPPVSKRTLNTRRPLRGQNPDQLLLFNTVAGHNIMIRASLLRPEDVFPEDVFFDWWICFLALCRGRVEASSDVLTYHRSHGHNLTLGKNDEGRQPRHKAQERIRALEAFIPLLRQEKRSTRLAENLLSKLNTLGTRRFSPGLFLFLLRHASTLFFFKHGLFALFRRIKISYRMSWSR